MGPLRAGSGGGFLAVLDRYRDTIVEAVFGIVERPEASLAEIRAYFNSLVEHHSVTMPAMVIKRCSFPRPIA
jgi:hypothetical protein